jgi:hypothetical protein
LEGPDARLMKDAMEEDDDVSVNEAVALDEVLGDKSGGN